MCSICDFSFSGRIPVYIVMDLVILIIRITYLWQGNPGYLQMPAYLYLVVIYEILLKVSDYDGYRVVFISELVLHPHEKFLHSKGHFFYGLSEFFVFLFERLA